MEKLSRSEEKLIRSLHQKKGRQAEGCFIIEGEKLLEEAVNSSYQIRSVYATSDCRLINNLEIEIKPIDGRSLKKVSALKTPPACLAMVEIPQEQKVEQREFNLLLDRLQNPGNLGTILRSAAAFGFKNIICSPDTVDCYNPKVVQASMGAIFHLQINYTELDLFFDQLPLNHQIYGADLQGENIYKTKLSTPASLVMGNESKGISAAVNRRIDQQLKIPQEKAIESLNVSMATSIILSEFRRQLSWQ